MTTDDKSYPTEITIYLQTPDGFDGLLKVTEVESRASLRFLKQLSAGLKDAGFITSSTAQRNQASTTAVEKANDNPRCEDCGGLTERKQGTAKNGKAWAGYFCIATKDQPKERQHAPHWI